MAKPRVVVHNGPPLPTLYSRPRDATQHLRRAAWVVKNARGETVRQFSTFEEAEGFIAEQNKGFFAARDKAPAIEGRA